MPAGRAGTQALETGRRPAACCLRHESGTGSVPPWLDSRPPLAQARSQPLLKQKRQQGWAAGRRCLGPGPPGTCGGHAPQRLACTMAQMEGTTSFQCGGSAAGEAAATRRSTDSMVRCTSAVRKRGGSRQAAEKVSPSAARAAWRGTRCRAWRQAAQHGGLHAAPCHRPRHSGAETPAQRAQRNRKGFAAGPAGQQACQLLGKAGRTMASAR